MKIKASSNINQVLADLRNARSRSGAELAKRINSAAFAVRGAEQRAMGGVFDRPTRFVTGNLWVEQATPARPVATVAWRYPGGKSVDPAEVIAPHVYGGQRRFKGAERALARIGAMPSGWYMVPGVAAPKDAYGNVPGSFVVRLLSYLSAFGEQGYRANMTDKRRQKLAQRGRTDRGFATIGGVEYFVSRGPGTYFGRKQHLARGIWARSGIHGVVIRPVFLFVPSVNYKRRFDFYGIADRTLGRSSAGAADGVMTGFLQSLFPSGR